MVGILLITLGFWTLVFWRVGNAYNGFREYRRRAVKTGFPVVETRECDLWLEEGWLE